MPWKPPSASDGRRSSDDRWRDSISKRSFDLRRGSPSKRGYDRTWEKLRRAHLSVERLCRRCLFGDLVIAGAFMNLPPLPDLALPQGAVIIVDHSHLYRNEERGWQPYTPPNKDGENDAQKRMLVVAIDVDHVVAIRERPDLRLVDSNLQSLCKACHSSKTQAEVRARARLAAVSDSARKDEPTEGVAGPA